MFLPAKLGPNGPSKMYPHNIDDRQLHFRRCKLNQELALVRRGIKAVPKPKEHRPHPGQKEMFK